MKHLTAFLLVLCLLFSPAALFHANAQQGSGLSDLNNNSNVFPEDNQEIQRAIGYGFVPSDMQGEWDNAMTYGEFCSMLCKVMVLSDPNLQSPFPELSDELSDTLIDRQEAMLACMFTGLAMGLNEANNYDEEQKFTQGSPDQSKGSLLYPDWNKSVTISTDGNGTWDDYIIAGAFYGMRQVSPKSGRPLFVLTDSDLRTSDLLTREEAVLAAVRLYESVPEKSDQIDKLDALPQTNINESAIAPDNNPEIQRAIAYGFVPSDMRSDWDNAVTYNEFCTMLYNTMRLADPVLLIPWPALSDGLSDELMDRQEAFIASMLAGLAMGLNNARDYDEEQQVTKGLPDQSAGSQIYPDWNTPVNICTIENGQWDNHLIGGAFYVMRQVSKKSGMPLFTSNDGDLRSSDYLTREEAALAAVRLYESLAQVAFSTVALSDTVAPFAPDTPGEDFDIQRAFRFGIVPEEIRSNRNAQITYKQFCTMLESVIATIDKSLVVKWEETAEYALKSEKKIMRQEAMLALYYAAEILGVGDTGNYSWVGADGALEDPWKYMTFNYPEFPNWRETPPLNMGDYLTSSYFYCMGRISRYSGKMLFDWDDQIQSMRPADPCTVEEAVKAAQRLMDTVTVVTSMENALTNTVPIEAIEAGKRMPTVSPHDLPKWYGYVNVLGDHPSVQNWQYYSEKSIKQISDIGLNFLRMDYQLKDLFIEEDGRYLVNMTTITNLDEIITWCAEYGVHVTLMLHTLPGLIVGVPEWEAQAPDIFENPEHYRQALEIYDFLSKRYANIPNNLLSYLLLSEPALNYFTYETHAKLVEDLAAVVWKNNPERLIIASAPFDFDPQTADWVEACFTRPNYLLDNSIVQAETFYLSSSLRRSATTALLNGWPYDEAVVVSNMVLAGNPPFTLKGNFAAGTEVTLYINRIINTDHNAYLLCTADGKEAGKYPLTGFTEGKDNCDRVYVHDNGSPSVEFGSNGNYNGLEVTFTLKKKASTISLAMKGVKEGMFFMTDVMVKTPADTQQNYMVVDNRIFGTGIQYERGNFTSTIIHCAEIHEMPASTVTIKKDGTYNCKQKYKKDVFDLNSARAHFDMWEAWSKETGGSYINIEFCSIFSMPRELRVNYMRSIMELFKEYDLSWTFFANTIGSGGIIVYKGAENIDEMFPGAPVQLVLPADGSYSVNTDYNYPCYYDDAVISVIQEYMK